MVKPKCKVCGEVAFNKQKQSSFCKRCYKAYDLGYGTGYHASLNREKRLHKSKEQGKKW